MCFNREPEAPGLRVGRGLKLVARRARMFDAIYGVDFSGARLAGQNIWVARGEPRRRKSGSVSYHLTDLSCLAKLCGTAERGPALAHLVDLIAASERALWALDFPFGLPVEVMEPGCLWPGQLDFLR